MKAFVKTAAANSVALLHNDIPLLRILIIDDEEKLRQLLSRIIRLEGFDVREAGTMNEAKKILQKDPADILLCDVKLPDANGVEAIAGLKALSPHSEIILLTAYGNIADGVQAMRNGAFDYITKGDDNDKIIPLLQRAAEKIKLAGKVQSLQQQLEKKYAFDSIIGSTAAIRDVVTMAQKVAATDTTVLLLGETGTGKEVFARAIHQASPRRKQEFVALNCSSFTRELLESELFGHKAGAFTGAVKDKKGLLEEANGGTVFLDEIGELPLELQAKLLRVLENGEYIKLGDTKTHRVNVRVIAATNRNLQQDATAGLFRSDLYFRLSVFSLSLPPLRERTADIPLLAEHFAAFFAERTNKKTPRLSKDYIRLLQQYSWPGNIRELKNILERSLILADNNELQPEHLPADLVSHSPDSSSFDLASAEKAHIRKILQHTGGNKTEAARLLQIGISTLYRKLEEYQLG